MNIDVKQLRTSMGLSQDGLARKIGCSWISVHNWEAGLHRPTGLYYEALIRLARQVARQKEREAAAKRIAEANGEMLHVT
ncbi:MAG: helix-turn-helix transcriptional regulator [Acidobacteriota bacterium]